MTDNAEFLQSYLQSLKNHSDALNSLKLRHSEVNKFKKEMEESTKNVTALQTVGQMIAEVVTVIENSQEIFEQEKEIKNPYLEKSYMRKPSVKYSNTYIVKTNMGPKYIVGAKPGLVIKEGARVSLDMTTLTIMNILPREVDPAIFSMTADEQTVSYKNIGGLGKEVRELREVIELPLLNPEIFSRLGIKPPKGVLLYGPPGTGKTLMARAAAASLNVTFLRVVASSLIEKYIGESARMIRELFAYAKMKAPSVIFIDEIDAIGGKRTGSINSSDREVQRTLMELLNQMDGFSQLQQVKVIMATNRPDILDEALLRPGRLDRKIEISLPLLNARIEILKIYIDENENIDTQLLGELTEGFNGADLCHLCTEAGYSAIRDERDHRIMSDYLKAVRKIQKNKQVEGRLEYNKK